MKELLMKINLLKYSLNLKNNLIKNEDYIQFNNQINNKFTNNCEYLLFHAYIEKHVMEKLKNLTSKKIDKQNL